jgi:zinc transporter ZupT
MILISLTIHSFFEGLAFGLMPNMADTMTLGVGIILHKGGEALALGDKV